MSKEHHYSASLKWTGNKGFGTSSYIAYGREFEVQIEGKPLLNGSADPAFRGNVNRYNPEELLLISISSCHMLWYLHLCADHNIVVVEYSDAPTAIMEESANGGRFITATLHPTVRISDTNKLPLAIELHELAHKKCFIANSLNFPVDIVPEIIA